MTDIAERLDLAVSTISKHICAMKQCGLVNMTEDGNKHIYSLGWIVEPVRIQNRCYLAVHSQNGDISLISLGKDVAPPDAAPPVVEIVAERLPRPAIKSMT